MKFHLLLSSLFAGAMLSLLSGCIIVANGVTDEPSPPSGGHLVASGGDDKNPLLFIAPNNGQVMFYSNSNLLATISVVKDDRVELNNPPPASGVETQVTVNGKSMYAGPGSPAHSKFYFKPGPPAANAAAEPAK